MSIVKLNERFERIERAYHTALAGREPESVSVFDLLPTISAAVPGTNIEQITETLRCWRAKIWAG